MSENVFAPPRASLDVHEGPEVLWEVSWKDIRKLYLASVNIRALGVLYALGALAVMALSVPAIVDDSRVGRAAPELAGVAGLFLLIGGLEVAGAITSFTRPRWGRWIGILLCIFSL